MKTTFKKAIVSGMAVLLTSSAFVPAVAQEQSTEEQLKNISIMCASIYQVQIETGATTTDAATKRDQMKKVYMALAKVSETDVNAQVTEYTTPLKAIKASDAKKWDEYIWLCEELSKPAAS